MDSTSPPDPARGLDEPARASVVVATVGRAGRLAVLVDAVLADPGTLELIVVVDGPDRDSLDTLARLASTRPSLESVEVPRGGQLAALDEGVRRARGDVVVLLDDDVVPDRGTIAGHAARHRAHPGTVVVGPMPVATVGPGASAATRLYAVEYLRHVDGLGGQPGRDVLAPLWAGNLSLRREDCIRVGLANPGFRANYHQDRELGYRLADAGLVGVFDPALTASHHHRRHDASFLDDAARQGEGRVALHRLHAGRLGEFQPRSLVQDLPPAVRIVVAASGSTRLARPLAGALMVVGRWWERLAPGVGDPLGPPRLARRIMQWHGARLALGRRAGDRTPA